MVKVIYMDPVLLGGGDGTYLAVTHFIARDISGNVPGLICTGYSLTDS